MTGTDLTAVYEGKFYGGQSGGSERAAEVIVPLILKEFSIESVVDFGCGVGAWIKKFSDAGVSDILGLDGGGVPEKLLKIPTEKFQIADFTKDLSVGSFDLAIALEVAEHLPEGFGDHFVGLLTDSAPVVLFSAAIPEQGGTNHVNERWQSYWCEKFVQRDYEILDIIRPEIWNNTRIPVWYRQNILVFCKRQNFSKKEHLSAILPAIDLVHPELWLTRLQSEEKIRRNQFISRPQSITSALRVISLSLNVIMRRIAARLGLRK